MKVLVTGGSGFIGSHVVDVLLDRGFEVANFDIKPPTFQRQLTHWREGDLLDGPGLKACILAFRPDYVIHLAAKAEIYSTDWADFASIHQGTQNLLDAIDGYGRLKGLVNTSTQLVIGPGEEPRSLLDFRPYTTYGEAKAYAEALLYQWQSAVPWLTVRPANIWGPHHPSFADAIWKYIRQRVYLHPASAVPVTRTYGYVRNTAEQIVGLMQTDPRITSRQVYYVADSVLDSAIWADGFSLALTGRPARRVPPSVLKAMGVAGDIAARLGKRLPMDSGRAMRMTQSYPVPLHRTLELTGSPRVSFDAGVAESIAWLNEAQAMERGR